MGGGRAAGLKTLVMMQVFNGQNVWGAPSPGNFVSPDPYPGPGADPLPPEAAGPRQFLNVFVIVNLSRTGGKTLGELSDYVAMLALSQPRSLGGCAAIPSITDMFSGSCPGRTGPKSLTPGDLAYLTALYTSRTEDDFLPRGSGSVTEAAVTERMAQLLANPRLASR